MILFSLLLQTLSFAGTYEVIGPCEAEPVRKGSYEISAPQSAGKVSVDVFDRDKISYIGSELGFNSILNTPTDKEAIEWLGPKELRAYGWCYEIDGYQPELMPSDVILKGSEKLVWFYAFSHYKDGKFISQCEPAFQVRWKKICN